MAVVLFILLSTVAFQVLGVGVPVGGGERSAAAEVKVERSRAQISVPLQARAMWRWNNSDTPNGSREYAWELVVSAPTGKYRAGFALFKFPGSTPRSGSLAELLRAGQSSLWLVSGSGDEVIEDEGIVVEPARDAIRIHIKGRSLLERLFAARPQEVEIVSQVPGDSTKVESVRVQYAVP